MEPGSVIDDRFEVLRLAATGGMGAVYEALDRTSGVHVALKVVLAEKGREGYERFAREARLLADLRHPAIVQYVAHGAMADGSLYLAMEWLEGEDVAARLHRSGFFPHDAVTLAIRVAEALGVAHAKGIVHRDIKPSNLWLEGKDVRRVKLLDFGIAALARADRDLTRTGTTIGTPGYIAPEQARGSAKLDGRVDLFALGCVLFESLTGGPPFVGDHPVSILAKVLIEDPPRVRDLCPGLPGALDLLVASLLEKDPASRPRDAAEVVHALTAIQPLLTDLGPGPTSARKPALTKSEHRVVSVILAAGALAVPAGVRRDDAIANAETLPVESITSRVDPITRAIAPFGGRAEALADGSVIVTFLGQGGVTDQVARAARAALLLKDLLPDAPIALATGRSLVEGRAPSGEAIDRATAFASLGKSAHVRIDEITARLIDRRFELQESDGEIELLKEREGEDRSTIGINAVCVGRDRELANLEALFDSCVDEPVAKVVLVIASAGVGKTRLRRELKVRLQHANASLAVWSARGDPMSAGATLGMVAQIVREACGVKNDAPLEARQESISTYVARSFSGPDAERVTTFLCEIADARFVDGRGLELVAARADPMLMSDQTRRAFEDLVETVTRKHPLLITLDDLHWGDQASVKYIDQALRQLHDRPLLVVASARPEIETDLPGIFAERDVEIVRLGELPKRAAETLVRTMLGPSTSDEIVARIVERGAGNALYLEELVRAVSEGKGEDLPDTVLAMVQSRLEGLEGDARLVLRAASLFGRVFWESGVASLVDKVSASRWLELLAEREIIVKRRTSRFGNEAEYTFRHALFREASYAMLTPKDRAAGHALAAAWLELHGEREPIILAEHFERAGAHDKSAVWYERAAAQALEGSDLPRALSLAEKALAYATPEVRLRVLVLTAEIHNWRGDYPLARVPSREALTQAEPGSPTWFSALASFAFSATRSGSDDETEEVTQALLSHAPKSGSLKSYASAAAAAVTRLLRLGRRAEIDALMTKLTEIEPSVEREEPVAFPHILVARSWRAMFDGDLYRCLELDIELCDRLAALGDVRLGARERCNMGYDLLSLGAFERAETVMRETLEIGTRLGIPSLVTTAKHNLGLTLLRLGRLDEAEKIEREAIIEIVRQSSAVHTGNAHIYLGLILLGLGRSDEALSAFQTALGYLDDLPAGRAWPLSEIALFDLAKGNAAMAIEKTRIAQRAIDETQAEEGDARVRLIHAQCLYAAGEVDEAKKAIRAASDRLMARAEMIRDETLKKAFLERIDENARTLSLRDEWIADE